MKNLFFVFLFFVSTSFPVYALDLTGSNDPQYIKAVEAWLDDDDKASLPMFSKLANNGNVAARLTLAGIEIVHKRGITPYFNLLTRKEKIALMRFPKGLSGTSWLRVEADTSPLARAILKTWEPKLSEKTIRNLVDLGEPQMAMELIERLMRDGKQQEILNLAADGLILSERQHLVWISATLLGHQELGEEAQNEILKENPNAIMGYYSNKGGADRIRKAVFFGDFESPSLSPSLSNNMDKWLIEDASMAGISAMCKIECPQAPVQCARITYQLLPDYDMVVAHDTPLESTIPQARFLKSKRSRNILMRYAADRISDVAVDTPQSLAGRGTVNLEKVQEVSACLADKLIPLR